MTTQLNKDHWRSLLNTKYLAGEELLGETVVTINEIYNEDVYSMDSKSKVRQTLIKFTELDKPMILTSRKAKQISRVLGSGIVTDWFDKKITLFPNEEKHFGQFMLVINVKEAKTMNQATFDKIVKSLTSDENKEKALSYLDNYAESELTIKIKELCK